MTNQHYHLRYLKHDIDFELVRSPKRRTVAIQIYRHKIVVRAPTLASIYDITNFVKSKCPWIIKQREKVAALPAQQALTYQTGELHYYLGTAYPLKIFVGGPHEVKLTRGAIHITTPTRQTSPQIKAKLERWYHARAEAIFPAYLAKWHQHPYFKHKRYPELTIRRMRGRWGSLNSAGDMTLNSQLVKAAEASIDYVVLHEFCHLLHFNHSPSFYKLVTELMPTWKLQKQALKQLTHGQEARDDVD